MKVVIIDDEPLISDKLKRIMETGLRGMHTVCAFTDAQMALDYIEQEQTWGYFDRYSYAGHHWNRSGKADQSNGLWSKNCFSDWICRV